MTLLIYRRKFVKKNLKMFYPSEGLCRAEPEGGPIVFTFHFIGVDNGTGIFKITIFRWPF